MDTESDRGRKLAGEVGTSVAATGVALLGAVDPGAALKTAPFIPVAGLLVQRAWDELLERGDAAREWWSARRQAKAGFVFAVAAEAAGGEENLDQIGDILQEALKLATEAAAENLTLIGSLVINAGRRGPLSTAETVEALEALEIVAHLSPMEALLVGVIARSEVEQGDRVTLGGGFASVDSVLQGRMASLNVKTQNQEPLLSNWFRTTDGPWSVQLTPLGKWLRDWLRSSEPSTTGDPQAG